MGPASKVPEVPYPIRGISVPVLRVMVDLFIILREDIDIESCVESRTRVNPHITI
jgi:hypothetical protein